MKFEDEFYAEFKKLDQAVQDELLAMADVLSKLGPSLKRPHADTLNRSKYKNMKELRFSVGTGVWRVAFALDPKQDAILLVAGNKVGVSKTVFYERLIAKADRRYAKHLKEI